MAKREAQPGFTLIEVMVVLIIIAVMVTAVGLSVGASDQARLRSSCWTLAAAVRFGYSHAITQGRTVRLVMDFEKRAFHLEESGSRVVLTREDETGEGLRRADDDDEGADGGVTGGSLLDRQMNSSIGDFGEGSASGSSSAMPSMLSGLTGFGGSTMGTETSQGGDLTSVMDGVVGGQLTDPFLSSMQSQLAGNPAGYRRPRFKAIAGRRGEDRELEGDTIFKAVHTPHDPTPREEGRAFLYFFPRGLTEHAFVQLSDGGERVYSLEIHPLTGRAVIYNEEISPPDDLDELQEAAE